MAEKKMTIRELGNMLDMVSIGLEDIDVCNLQIWRNRFGIRNLAISFYGTEEELRRLWTSLSDLVPDRRD